MRKLLSTGSCILQAVLVVAAVLVFAYYDPFGIFTNNKLSIRDTPAQVKQIKAIGELVTAEYYGEVISSYQSIVKVQQNIALIKLKQDIRALDSSFKYAVLAITRIDDKKVQKTKFDDVCAGLERNTLFACYLSRVKDHIPNKPLLSFRGKYDFMYTELVKNNKINGLAADTTYYIDLFEENRKDVTDQFTTRRVRKSQLILLGRGKVQAGFRFDSLTERNVKVDTLHNRILIVGMEPQLLSCDINPWFVPELGIKGFEIIDVNGKANDVAILSKVKKNCLDSLRRKALDSHILTLARTNAEQNLKQLFGLLLNNPAIDVRIVCAEDSVILRSTLYSFSK
jgi:hypothetical protein